MTPTVEDRNWRQRRSLVAFPTLVLLLACAAPVTAQEQRDEAATAEGHFFAHEVSFILAGTWETHAEPEDHHPTSGDEHNGGRNFFTLGGEYEFRLHRLFGVGATVEYITHERNWLFIFPAYVHAYRGLKLVAGPGFERRHEEGKTEAVLRLGAMYGFEFAERYAITPSIALDLVGRENAVVYGVNLGVVF